jgi:hypothetical protein
MLSIICAMDLCNGWKHTMKGPKNFLHYIIFQGCPCLNFNHVTINKDFHNVWPYYGSQNTNKSNAKETTFFYFVWCAIKLFLCRKNVHHNVLKITNILKKMIEIILYNINFVKIKT